MGIQAVDKHKGIIGKALSSESGRALVALLRESYVDIDLMGKTDRETIENVAKHDLVIYLIDMGDCKNV